MMELASIDLIWILHDWSDEECIKILKNCRKAIGDEKRGKVIIVDSVLKAEGKGVFDDTALVFDLLMIAHSSGGKERTELEWNNLLRQAGFPRYNIINIPALVSIIEAYPL
ncbi:(R,S)-reticuline 7-O-methyltransferase-like [Senna tora]|uniref:(R,S)-reticuline 7-O-methyltransferase-like n=1 Tax=Senna tora TaxID=362788 RepID=A0A834WG09_9FABA|nr:(R,S)-reticuline 7-O-methyltransferase-like [Senna tora]